MVFSRSPIRRVRFTEGFSWLALLEGAERPGAGGRDVQPASRGELITLQQVLREYAIPVDSNIVNQLASGILVVVPGRVCSTGLSLRRLHEIESQAFSDHCG